MRAGAEAGITGTKIGGALSGDAQFAGLGPDKRTITGKGTLALKDRKLALWVESLLQDGLKAGDDLSQGVEKLAAETGRLAALVEAVVVRREAPLAAQLAHFRFSENLATLLDTCRSWPSTMGRKGEFVSGVHAWEGRRRRSNRAPMS